MLSCSNINISYDDNYVINDFSLTFLPTAIMVILGPNGSGKTSLLRILAKLSNSYSGKIEWEGNNIIDNPVYHRNLCYISHKNALKEEMTILENLLIWAKLRSTELLLPVAISYFGLEKLLDLKIGHLSAGWQKKIALARLILSDSKLWLLDEPEVNLDEETTEKLLNLMIIKANQGGIVIISSHNSTIYKKFQPIYLKDFCGTISDNI